MLMPILYVCICVIAIYYWLGVMSADGFAYHFVMMFICYNCHGLLDR